MSQIDSAAEWMAATLAKEKMLYQDVAVDHIASGFGEELISTNSNGNRAIIRDVLAVFNKLTPDIVWVRSGRYWRSREDFDLPGRQQP